MVQNAPRRRSGATIFDVAAAAGVSPGTVSRALNGTGQLRAETRQRVAEAAEALGFLKHGGSSAASSRSYIVGVLSTDMVGRFSLPVVLGIEEALGSDEISVLLCDTRDDPVREQHYIRTLLNRRVDGIIVTGRRRMTRKAIGHLSVPVMYVLCQSDNPEDPYLTYDDRQGATLAIEHLLTLGRRSIAHITGPQHHESARERELGGRATLTDAGYEWTTGRAWFGAWSEEWGRTAIAAALVESPTIDAVFCGSDQIARGVSDALREMGRQVPDDIAIVGFDNWDVMAMVNRPPLTSVDPNLVELGRQAGGKMLEFIQAGSTSPWSRELPCSLIVRSSTAARPLSPAMSPSAPEDRD